MSEKKKKSFEESQTPGMGDNVIKFEPRPSGPVDDGAMESGVTLDREVDLDSLEEADEIMYDALTAQTEEETLRLAQEALSVSEDCTDAWVLLGHFADTLDDAIEYYNKGIEAAERVLGEGPFIEDIGNFWGLLETRPYMRALFGLATCMESAGYLEDAANFYQGMLILNPNDNQGVRYPLVQILLELDRNEEAEALFSSYDESIEASWNYSRALFDFRKHGDSKISNQSLKAAIKSNGVIPDYILSHKELPEELPDEFPDGEDEVATLYAVTSKHVWEADPKAMSWLEVNTVKRP